MPISNLPKVCSASVVAIGLISTFFSCTPPKAVSQKPSPAVTTSPRPGQDATATNSPTPTGKSEIDLVIVVAIGSKSSDQAVGLKTELASALAEIGSAMKSKDVHVALIASPVGQISGIPVLSSSLGLPSEKVQQVNFELDSKDSILGTLVTGCDAAASNLDSSHAAGSIKVCGQSIAIPVHSWTWTVQDLKGKLLGFLRPGAKRIYLLIANGDPGFMSVNEFTSIAASQNNGVKPVVHAIIPQSAGSNCPATLPTATLVSDLVRSTGGSLSNFCSSGWKNNLSQIVRSFN